MWLASNIVGAVEHTTVLHHLSPCRKLYQIRLNRHKMQNASASLAIVSVCLPPRPGCYGPRMPGCVQWPGCPWSRILTFHVQWYLYLRTFLHTKFSGYEMPQRENIASRYERNFRIRKAKIK